MGNEVFNESHPYQYTVFKTAPKQGESGILVNTRGITQKTFIDRYTEIDCIEYYKEKDLTVIF